MLLLQLMEVIAKFLIHQKQEKDINLSIQVIKTELLELNYPIVMMY